MPPEHPVQQGQPALTEHKVRRDSQDTQALRDLLLIQEHRESQELRDSQERRESKDLPSGQERRELRV